MKQVLLIPRIKIHNANALSSPYTIGFPAMSAWLGFMHNLQRKLSTDFVDIKFNGVAVSVHEINLHTHKGDSDFNYSIISKRNPLGKGGKAPSFIEEARCDLEVSIAIECENIDTRESDIFHKKLISILHQSKIASGDVMSFQADRDRLKCFKIIEETDFKKFLRYLMPGFCLVARQDLMQQAMQQGKDGIDAMLEYLKITTEITINEKGEQSKTYSRKEKGWIVPIPLGFQGISDLSLAEDTKNSRDDQTPHRFAESVVSLGEFIMPYRFDNIEQLFWRYKPDIANNLYLYENNFIKKPQESKL
ncbi:CRISPR-associated protein, Csy2 family [uncultured Gammaproteobacteria bacterium]|jgi:CRISPR-associated protein Csy2|nr:CRISPR-associated protein, Csy2 family [uncultured Gammaproteobacteria bacterium]